MKLIKRRGALVAAGVAAAMVLSACGSDEEGGGSDEGSGGEGADRRHVQHLHHEPQNPLVPGNTTESEGDQVVNSLWTGLVTFSAEGELEYDGVAESIESEDNTNWTITLKDGWTFHDGTPVNAESFVNAWNYTAYSPNAQQGSGYFSRIAGYEDLQAPTDATGEMTGDPAATEMSGLEVVDDLTFTVELTAPSPSSPIDRRLQPVLPAARGLLRRPGGLRRAADRQRPVPGRGGVRPGRGHHPDPVRGLRG